MVAARAGSNLKAALTASGVRLDWEIKRIGNFKPGEAVLPFNGEGQ